MKKSKPFYIGWQEEMSTEHKSAIRKFIIPIFVALPILAFLLISFQKGFNNHQFDFGNLKELTGIYHSKPIPILEVTDNNLPEGFSNQVLLVGYGKFGAEGIMDDIEKSKGSLDGKKITIAGTLIYGDGKTLLELTKEENSLIEMKNESIVRTGEDHSFKSMTMTGEILDPKCYFGVMKPGEGKIHKSCAIRCISGGIPPVFRTTSVKNENEYYILLGEKGEKINHQVLDRIAEPVEVTGKVSFMNGWNYLYLNPEAIKLIEG